MLKKTVAGAALIAAAIAIPGASAYAHVSPGNASVAPAASAVEPVAYYRGHYAGPRHYHRPYAYGGYRTWGVQPYVGGYRPGYSGYYGGWGYPTGYWGNGWGGWNGWGPGVSVGIAPGVGIGFGF